MGFISFLEENMLSCRWKEAGIECTGCGMQRSIVHLLKGEFIEAFNVYPAIYTLMIMGIFLVLHLKFNFTRGHKILLWLFIINLIIIISNFIIKLI